MTPSLLASLDRYAYFYAIGLVTFVWVWAPDVARFVRHLYSKRWTW